MRNFITIITVILIISALTLPIARAREDTPLQPLAYVIQKMKTHDLVFMGTTHKQPSILGLIDDLLPRLTSAGVTHLALEVGRDQQPGIDRYLSTGRGLSNIALLPAIDCPAYRRLLQTLHDLPAARRPRVVAIDLPPADYGGSTGRDAHMAMVLNEILERRPGAKILAVLGSHHVLRKLEWLPRITRGHKAIRTQLAQWRPDLMMFSMVHITRRDKAQSDFYGLAPAAGTMALDVDRRYSEWRLGITESLALRPSPPHELVDGVVIHHLRRQSSGT